MLFSCFPLIICYLLPDESPLLTNLISFHHVIRFFEKSQQILRFVGSCRMVHMDLSTQGALKAIGVGYRSKQEICPQLGSLGFHSKLFGVNVWSVWVFAILDFIKWLYNVKKKKTIEDQSLGQCVTMPHFGGRQQAAQLKHRAEAEQRRLFAVSKRRYSR